MLPKGSEKESSSNLVKEESKHSESEKQSGPSNKPSAIIGTLFSIHCSFLYSFGFFVLIEDVTSKAKLLASASWMKNTIDIIELETKQKYATFDGVQLSETCGGGF